MTPAEPAVDPTVARSTVAPGTGTTAEVHPPTEAERVLARRAAAGGPDGGGQPGTWKWWHTLLTLAIVALIVGLAIFAASSKKLITSGGNLPLWTFIGLALLMAAFIALAGWGITGNVAGALIEPKKGRMSLSRLQVILWTILVLSAYLTAFIVNVASDKTNPLTVAIPPELLIAMGLSITTLAGTGIVLNYKQNQLNPAGAPERVRLQLEARNINYDDTTGVLVADRAQWRDIFEGDTPDTATYLDLGKIQLFYITVALVLGYAIAVGNLFTGVDVHTGVTTLPAIDKGFVALLAISHAGYLTTKAAS
jgi:hypothetical protein